MSKTDEQRLRLLDRATVCKRIADESQEPEKRERFLRVAQSWEWLASLELGRRNFGANGMA